jgi:hypothetical protein
MSQDMLKALFTPEAVTKETPSTPLKPVKHVNEVPPLNKGEKSKTPAKRTPSKRTPKKRRTPKSRKKGKGRKQDTATPEVKRSLLQTMETTPTLFSYCFRKLLMSLKPMAKKTRMTRTLQTAIKI